MKETGFSLIEILVVFALFGVLATLIVPSGNRWRVEQGVRAAAREFGITHALARATAVRRGRVTEFHIDPVKARFWIEVETDAAGASDTVGMVRDMGGRGMSLSSNRTLVCFDGRGMPTTRVTNSGEVCQAGDALVQFAISGHTQKLMFTPLGRLDRSK